MKIRRTHFDRGFVESDHPREADGEFAPKGGGSSASSVSPQVSQKVKNGIDRTETGKGKKEFFHGTRQGSPTLHIGQTFADNKDTADNYANQQTFNGSVDLEGLTVAHVKAFDRDDANYGALGDSTEDIEALQAEGVDLIVYDDEDPEQRQHKAYRIVSEKALERFKQGQKLTDNRPSMVAEEAINWEGFPDDPEEVKQKIQGKNAQEIHEYLLSVLEDEEMVKDLIRDSKAEFSKKKAAFKKARGHARVAFAQFEALSEGQKAGFYPGVLVIECGPAKGHYAVKMESGRVVNFDYNDPEHAKLKRYPITIAESTLDDVVKCGNDSLKVKCKLDHGSTVKDIVGNYATFRRDGDKVRADLTLLKSYPHRDYVQEIIAELSNKIGNSIDFDYNYEIQGDKAVARCVKLNSVDIVDTPAATNSLFEETKQTQTEEHMPLSKEDLAAIRCELKDEVASQLGAIETKFNTRFDAIKTKLEEGQGDDEADKDKEKKKDDDKASSEMSALVEKAVLAAVKKAMPKAGVTNFSSEEDPNKGADTYEAKFAIAKGLGMSDGVATAFMARNHKALYNAKFGAKA